VALDERRRNRSRVTEGEAPARPLARGATGDQSRTAGTSVARGGMWNLASRSVPQLYVIVLSIAAARFLGPHDFGRQSFIAFVELSVVMLLTAGLPTSLIRYVADALGRGEPQTARGLFRWARLTMTTPTLAAAVILGGLGLGGAEPRLAWLSAGVAAAAGIFSRVAISFLNGLQRWRETSVVALLGGGAATALSVAVLALGGGITGMFAVEAVGVTIMCVALTVIARRREPELGPDVYLSAAVRRAALRYAGIASITVLLTFIIWRRSEFFVLDHYSTATQIGFYSIAFAASTAPTLILQGLTSAVTPAVSTMLGAGEVQRIHAGFARALRLLLLLPLPTTAAALALGPAAVRIAYGRGFDGATTPLLIILCLMPLMALVNLSASLLGGLGRLGVSVGAGVIASIVDIGLSFLLIPGHGAIGAAIANSAAQVAVGLPVIVYARLIVGRLDWRPATTLRLAFCSGLGGLTGWAFVRLLGDTYGLGAGLAAGFLVFVVVASVARILAHDDARWLEEALGRVLQGVPGRLVRSWAGPSPEARSV
jgi:O-antigen/teichoic acid export membrane protein